MKLSKSRKSDTKKKVTTTAKTSNRSSPTDYSSSSFNLDNRGWLDNNSPSQERRPLMRTSPQDLLGSVSDEDILKLTKLTAEMEVRQAKVHHPRNRIEKDHEDNTRYRHQSHMQSTDRTEFPKKDDLVTQEDHVMRKEDSESPSTSKPLFEYENETLDPKRFRQQTVVSKPEKKQREDSSSKSPPAEVTEELNGSKSTQPNIATKKNADMTPSRSVIFQNLQDGKRFGMRRHSFDSIHSLMKQHSQHSKQYRITHHSMELNESSTNKNQNVPIDNEEFDEILAFDYESLPDEIKELIDLYRNEEELEIKNLLVKSDEDDEDTEDQTISVNDIIKGPDISDDFLIDKERKIVMLKVKTDDKREIISVKNINDHRVELHVSILGDKRRTDEYKEALDYFSKTVDIQAESLEQLKKRSTLFLEKYNEDISSIEPQKASNQGVRYSKYNLPQFGKEIEPLDVFMDRMQEEMKGFQNCLDDTEKTVHAVQIDIDDTQNRMETYIKDIPQNFYSELKTLEVKIDTILSKRAKNPWIDIGYALLSYLLAIIAIIVWVLIYMLKKGKKILLFPLKLWHTYRDYLKERNKLVRVASQISISGRRNSGSIDRRASQPIVFTSAAEMYESTVSQRIQERGE